MSGSSDHLDAISNAWKELAEAEVNHDVLRASRAIETLHELKQLPFVPAPRVSEDSLKTSEV